MIDSTCCGYQLFKSSSVSTCCIAARMSSTALEKDWKKMQRKQNLRTTHEQHGNSIV